uniref:Putative conserved plasma membrane protein n=1 Tax=Ixodes ricinus TaxID=34613 RepID=A0A6B0V9C7_IXORI
MTVAPQRTLVALVVVGRGGGRPEAPGRSPTFRSRGVLRTPSLGLVGFPCAGLCTFRSQSTKAAGSLAQLRFVRKDIALPRLRFVCKKYKKNNRSEGSKIWFVPELVYSSQHREGFDAERLCFRGDASDLQTHFPAGNSPHSRSFEGCVEVFPDTFCSSDFFLFPDPEARVAPVYYAYRVIQCTYGWSPSLVAAACFALVSIPLLWGALFPVGRAWVVVASLLVYKFGRCACVCATALSLPCRRLSFFVSTCVPRVWFICEAPQSVYGLRLVRLPRRQRMRRLCSIERAVI